MCIRRVTGIRYLSITIKTIIISRVTRFLCAYTIDITAKGKRRKKRVSYVRRKPNEFLEILHPRKRKRIKTENHVFELVRILFQL